MSSFRKSKRKSLFISKVKQKTGMQKGSADPEDVQKAKQNMKAMKSNCTQLESSFHNYALALEKAGTTKLTPTMEEWQSKSTENTGACPASLERAIALQKKIDEQLRGFGGKVDEAQSGPFKAFVEENIKPLSPLCSEQEDARVEFDTASGLLAQAEKKDSSRSKIKRKQYGVAVSEATEYLDHLNRSIVEKTTVAHLKSQMVLNDGLLKYMDAFEAFVQACMEEMKDFAEVRERTAAHTAELQGECDRVLSAHNDRIAERNADLDAAKRRAEEEREAVKKAAAEEAERKMAEQKAMAEAHGGKLPQDAYKSCGPEEGAKLSEQVAAMRAASAADGVAAGAAAEAAPPPTYDELPPEYDEMFASDSAASPPPQEAAGEAPPGYDDCAPPGYEETSAPPAYDETSAPPGYDESGAPPGYDDSAAPPAYEGSAAPPAYEEGQAPPSLTVSDIDAAENEGKAATKEQKSAWRVSKSPRADGATSPRSTALSEGPHAEY